MQVEELITGLESAGYFANKQIGYALLGAMETNRPLLVEGAPGVGKSSLAGALAQALNVPLIRLQCYEGISPESILYEYDYQRQLLVVSAIRDRLNDAMRDMDIPGCVDYAAKNVRFFGEDFLLERPILKALHSPGRKVLLIDEIDKASEEIEHTLLEALSDFAITIPELGTIRCAPEDMPVVILTSNRYRELSGALKRRCFYLFIDKKSRQEIQQILLSRVSQDSAFCARVADYLVQIGNLDLQHPVSISEGLDWARFLLQSGKTDEAGILDMAPYSIGLLAKDNADRRQILSRIFKVTQ